MEAEDLLNPDASGEINARFGGMFAPQNTRKELVCFGLNAIKVHSKEHFFSQIFDEKYPFILTGIRTLEPCISPRNATAAQ